MFATSYHDTVNDLQGLALSGYGPFAQIEWFTLLEQAGQRPFIALARDGRNALALPLTLTGNILKPMTNWYAFTWDGLATTDAPRAQMLAALAKSLRAQAARIVLEKLPQEHSVTDGMVQAFRSAGWITRLESCDVNHVLHVQGRSFAEYLATRPGPLRTTLKRKAKKVEVELLTQFHDDAWDSYERVYANSWKPEEGDPALLRYFAQAEGAAGRLRMALARHEGQVVAAQFWTVQHGTAWIHKLAHLESAKPLSPGTTLSAALFEQVIDRDGVTLVDFGTGDDPYKRDWMEDVRTRYRLTCWRPEVPRNWPSIGKAWLRTLVSRGSAG